MKCVLNKIKNKLKKINKKDIIIFMIPLILFGFYLIVFYPGTLSYDSYDQLNQISNMTFTTAHPFFHTFVEMILMKILDTPAIVGLFQILCFSLLWASICKYNRKSKSKTLFLFQVLLTLMISLSPLNKMISITLWKDVLYSYSILWFCFEIEKLIDKKFKIRIGEVIKLSFITILLPNLRHNGYAITIVMMIVLIVLFFIYDKKSRNYLKYFIICLVFFFLFQGLEKIYNVGEGLNASLAGNIIDYKMLSLSGVISREGHITEEQKNELKKYVYYNNLNSYAYYNRLDYIWLVCEPNEQLMNNHKAFYSMILDLVSNNKIVTLKYIMKETSFVWKIVRFKDSWGIINYNDIRAYNADVWYERTFENTKINKILSNYIYFTYTNTLFQTVFYSGALYLYLSIFFLILLKKKYKFNGFLILLPILINLGGLVLTMPVNDVRYYYSNFLILYLIVAIFFRYWVKNEKK